MADTVLPGSAKLVAPAYTARAIVQRQIFLRSAAEAWGKAGDADTASSLIAAADALAARHANQIAQP